MATDPTIKTTSCSKVHNDFFDLPPNKKQRLNGIIQKSLDGDDEVQVKPTVACTTNGMNINDIIHLNVGGIKYVTRRGTLMNFDESRHLLCCMFSGPYKTVQQLTMSTFRQRWRNV